MYKSSSFIEIMTIRIVMIRTSKSTSFDEVKYATQSPIVL